MAPMKSHQGGRMETLSLELATILYDLASWAFIISLVVGVVATCVMFLTGKVKEAHWDKERSASKERIAALDKETAEAKRGQAETELKLEEIRKRQGPRGLLIQVVVDTLRAAPPGKAIIRYQQGLPESALFASTLAKAVSNGGWEVLEVKGVPSITDGSLSQASIDISARSLDQSEPVQALMAAFTKAGYGPSGGRDETIPADTVRITVNPKP